MDAIISPVSKLFKAVFLFVLNQKIWVIYLIIVPFWCMFTMMFFCTKFVRLWIIIMEEIEFI